MQPESQVLIREFNRRLRSALGGAPKHVRMEAALEVESHVQDVLSRQPGDLPEPEYVARILQGFGTPEAYAQALLSQAPALEVVTVRTGVRDVAVAIGDLILGMGRLLLALLRGTLRLTAITARTVWHYGAVGFELCADLVGRAREAGREPAAQTVRGLGRLLRATVSAVGTGVTLVGRGIGALAKAISFLAGGAVRTGTALVRGVRPVVRWILRTCLILALSALALAAFGVAVFASLAPDVAGWWVYMTQHEIGRMVERAREITVARFSPAAQGALTTAGLIVELVAVGIGLAAVAGVVLIIWSGHRRKSQQPG